MRKHVPECPFCSRYIAVPEITKTEFGEILSGRCECGAVYVCDPTGRNTGEAYMEALALAKGDWKIDSMNPDDNYQMIDIDYDLKTHQRLYSKMQGSASGRLVFVKMNTQQGIGERSDSSESTASSDDAAGSLDTTENNEAGHAMEEKLKPKDRIKYLLNGLRFEDIIKIAENDKGVIRILISLSYDKQDVTSWRAIEAMGLISGALSRGRTEIVRDTVRRLLWSMGEESGGIGWSAAEMLGEIVRNNTDEFKDIIPIIWSFREELMFRAGTVWAMGRIASVRPELALFTLNDLKEMIYDKNPHVRGYAVWALGIMRQAALIKDTSSLANDDTDILFYGNGELQKRKVKDIFVEALA